MFGVLMKLDPDRQYAIYFLGFVVAIIIGYAVWQSEEYNEYHAVLYFGISVLVLLILNYLYFGQYLERSLAFVVGVVSVITVAFGTFHVADLILMIFALIISSCIVAGIYLSSSRN